MNRSFAKATIEMADGKRIPAVIACCSKCGTTEKLSANTFSGSIPPEASANKFRNNGWFISHREGKDLCPTCNGVKKSRKKGDNVVPYKPFPVEKKPVLVSVEPPRQPTKEDNRLIFAKLNEVYLDEKTGYSVGWSDEKVATDLGVPRAWVSKMREENFGAESLCEDARPLLDEAKKLLEAISVEADRLEGVAKNAATLRADLSKRADHLTGRITAMEKLFK